MAGWDPLSDRLHRNLDGDPLTRFGGLGTVVSEPVRHVEQSARHERRPAIRIDINRGLPELRKPWILERGDVEFYQGREVKPEDNGLRRGEASAVSLFDRGRRLPSALTLARSSFHARPLLAGIVTPSPR